MRLVAQQRWMLLLLAAALIFVTPNIVYAQLGGLSNMAKGKAAEALTNEVMKELDKKFTETVAKEPISEAAKAAVVKKLSEMARPIVKKFVDGAASGRPPNPAELAQTVMKEVMPRVPGLVAAAKTDGGGTTAASAQDTDGATHAQQTQPANMPKIAVYVFGAEDPATNKATATRLTAALSNSGRYQAADEYREFFERAAKEQGGTASLNSEQIQRLGWNFGVEYVCVAEITAALGEKQISAFIINAETGVSVAMGVAESPMKTLSEVADVAERVVSEMFKNAPPLVYTQNTTPVRQETAADVTAPDVAPIESAEENGRYYEMAHKRTFDYYFAPKYQTPLGTPVSWGGLNVEGGLIWGNGAFFGIDFGFGSSNYDGKYGYEDEYYERYYDDWYDKDYFSKALMIGGGLSLGKIYDFGNQWQLVYGGSAGIWLVTPQCYSIPNLNFVGPFVRLRWNFVEVMYRGLLGYYGRGELGFGWNNQLLLGLYFATSERMRR